MTKPAWDTSKSGLSPALASLKPTKAELAALEEIRVMQQGMGAVALTEEQKWQAEQVREIEYQDGQIAAFEAAGMKAKVLTHKRRKARALRNLGRFNDALLVIAGNGRVIAGSGKLRASILEFKAAVEHGTVPCSCEAIPSSYDEQRGNLTATITLEPRVRHTYERFIDPATSKMTYIRKCGQCHYVYLDGDVSEQRQAIYGLRSRQQQAALAGKPGPGVPDAELLKA